MGVTPRKCQPILYLISFTGVKVRIFFCFCKKVL
nr:MAG TPA_asm: hypothetical protein [Caudoviricetes sp.]